MSAKMADQTKARDENDELLKQHPGDTQLEANKATVQANLELIMKACTEGAAQLAEVQSKRQQTEEIWVLGD